MRVKDPSARQIKAALSVLAYFAVAADMANDDPRALAYAKAAAQLEAELVRVPQAAARAATADWTVEYRAEAPNAIRPWELKHGAAHCGFFSSVAHARIEVRAHLSPGEVVTFADLTGRDVHTITA